MMRTFVVNYHNRDGHRRWQAVNSAFYLHGVPRILLRCWLLGHKAVVGGVDPVPLVGEYRGDRYRLVRWVMCARCGERGNPQGSLDPQVYAIGDRYAGPWGEVLPDAETPAGRLALRDAVRGHRPPGPIPRRSSGTLGGQILVGRGYGDDLLGFELKVGNGGSEHVLAASFHLGPLGALYLHTADGIGRGVQRRLNPVGYESKVTGMRFVRGRLEWKLWSARDSGSRYGADREPWWRNGAVSFRWRDKLLGPRRYEYTDVPGGETARLVRMPEGDYLVSLKLQRCTLGRKRWRKTRSWSVDWEALGKGLPTKGPDRGRIFGSGVRVSGRAVRTGTWPAEAAAAIALRITQDRAGHGWEPTGTVPVDPAEVAA